MLKNVIKIVRVKFTSQDPFRALILIRETQQLRTADDFSVFNAATSNVDLHI